MKQRSIFLGTFVVSVLAVCFVIAGENNEEPAHGYAEVPEPLIYYETKGAGEAVVLIHGGNLDRRMWDEQFDLLSKNYYVIRYDVRNYGKSVLATHPYLDANDLAALLNQLKIDKTHIIGLSLGGRIGIDFAIAYPDKTRSLIAVGPGLSGFDWSRDSNQTFSQMIKAASEGHPEKAMELWLKDPYMAPAMEDPQRAQKIRQISLDNLNCWLANPFLERELDPPAIKRLGEIKAPTLIIVGSRDVPDIQKISNLLAKEIHGAQKIVISGSGHMVNMEKPIEFNKAVLDFLNQQKKS
jgi:pimeloyl-ACP methyl ester carboxylesterase